MKFGIGAFTMAVWLLGSRLNVLAGPTLQSIARDIEQVESVREIKDVQRSFAQLAQFGRWSDMAALFSTNGTLQWGKETTSGQTGIEKWLERDAGDMNGIKPGSLNTLVAENPLINLSEDGRTAKGRWNGLRFSGDGSGATRIQGGIYENEFVLENGSWKISLLHYYAMYDGPYVGGWRNVDGGIPIIPYHFRTENAGVPIPAPVDEAPPTNLTVQELAHRITRLNDEDAVRNLQNAYGYYVDRRMWTDVLDLCTSDVTAEIKRVEMFNGKAGIRRMVEKMGPEGLTRGILNDHPIFDTIVQVDADGTSATARGFEIGMIGDVNARTASWEFSVFRNRFVKEINGIWKLKALEVTPLIVADYSKGWGDGGRAEWTGVVPPFLNISARSSQRLEPDDTNTDITDMQRRLARSAAYDGVENISAAYGYWLDDLQCKEMGSIHAAKGHKLSPFTGFYQTPARITKACETSYGTNRTGLRSSISFHWRPQSVVLVSEDGRSATLRARLLQPSTSKDKAGSFNGAIYHDQMVLEDGKWKLFDITIDEFYWQSSSWAGGWIAVEASNSTSNSSESSLAKRFPPDLTLKDIGEREASFRGGSGPYLAWPDIQKMWFSYRNLVTGRSPEYYWPGCVPCKANSSWSLEANGYQEPPNGPVPVS